MHFSIKGDSELISKGTHFFCLGCLCSRPITDMSLDIRYCLPCFEFLLKEAEPLQGRKKPDWVPEVTDNPTKTTDSQPDGQEGVSKISKPITTPPIPFLKHSRGRPKGGKSRTTKWRREQEAKQGVLL